MAFWKRNCQEYERMARLIQERPGIRPSELAREMNISRSTVTRRLPSLEEAGILLSEDKKGGLWYFGRRE